MSKLLQFLLFSVVLLLIIKFNQDSLISFFSQDDFFHLRQVMDKEIRDIPSFFLPYNELGYAFYRPLTRELYSFVMYNLFQLSPLPYHLVNLILILINGFLTYKIVKTFNNQVGAIIAVIIYLFSSVHSIELYYLSSSHILTCSAFIILGLLSYEKYLKNRLKKYYYLTILFSILAIISHELGIVFILFAALLELMIHNTLQLKINPGTIKNIFIRLLPFLIILGIRLIFFFLVKSLPNEDAYQPIFSLKQSINILSWYTVWSFGLPEALLDFVGPKLVINQNFIQWYGGYIKIVFTLFLFLIIGIIMIIYQFRKYLIKDRFFYFLMISYIISLSPFLFFPQHRFVYYLGFATIWFSATIGYLLGFSWKIGGLNRLLVIIFIFLWSVISYNTINFYKITHWSAKRAIAAKSILKDIEQKYPDPPRNAVFYIQDDPNYPKISESWGTSSKQAFYILSGSDGLQLLYNNPNIKVYYQAFHSEEDIISKKDVIRYQATFPY